MIVCFIVLAAFLSVAMAGAWVWALRSGKSGLIDAIWSLAVGVACFAGAIWPMSTPDALARRWLVAAMTFAWSLRLGAYIFGRSLGAEDDPRYAALKKGWGADAPKQLFFFLQAQAVAGLPLVLAALLAAHVPTPTLRLLDVIGVVVFVIGLGGEAVADRQMGRFRADPSQRGRICEVGLWAYSRHPNYFFEWVCWLGFAIVAADFTGLRLWGWLAFGAPATMYWLLVHVSGVPPLESHLERSRPEAFADYRTRVSMFWPRPPKRIK